VTQDKKLLESVKKLNEALKYHDEALKNDLYFDAIVKRFEVCFEYAWKHLKRIVSESGQEVYSPRDTLKEAVKLKLIRNLELWLDFLEDRNLSVHDYLGSDEADYLNDIQKFAKEVVKLTK
jgi:nucleotidyltransferase substrate binding protein (TIGR01987 family)